MPPWVTRLARAMFPWPTRTERRQAIARARRDRIAAERKAEHARQAEAGLRAAVMDNHIAQAIARQIRGNR